MDFSGQIAVLVFCKISSLSSLKRVDEQARVRVEHSESVKGNVDRELVVRCLSDLQRPALCRAFNPVPSDL